MRITERITNTEDTLDTRDILERISWLDENETELDEDAVEELAVLQKLIEEVSYNTDEEPEYGIQLIRDTYFTDYAQELAENIGAISRSFDWPLCHIDWEAAADALKMDYTSIDFDGVGYWVRS
jgi:hypothetical protein